MVTVFVMAQGHQQRIGHMLGVNGLPAWKQLLKISDQETILARTCRMFLEAGVDTVVAVIHWHHELVNACMDQVLPFVVQRDPGPSVLDGIYNMRHLWGDRTVIALGDVVYSRDTIRRMVIDPYLSIYERPGQNATTGRQTSERFGITFNRRHHRELERVLADVEFRRHQDSKILELKFRLLEASMVPSIREVADYTDDIDDEEGYVKYLPLLREAVLRDT